VRFADILSPELPHVAEAHRVLLDRVRIVLVEPRHPGNIGSVARAMKVCGLRHLYLVSPCAWRDTADARMMGIGAHDVLGEAIEVATLDEALAGVAALIGTTHRVGRARGPMVPPRTFAEHLPAMLGEGPVAVLFGREDKGLSNDELARCQMAVHIPTESDYPSLNVSHAVMVVAYECFYAILTRDMNKETAPRPSYPAVAALAERIAALAERAGIRHPRGHVGLTRSLREAIRNGRMTERDFSLIHLLCRELARGLPPDQARTAPPHGDREE